MTSGVKTTVRVKIKAEGLTTRKRTRLKQITGRDTRIIKQYLKVIYHNEEKLVNKKREKKINKLKLNHLTLTTSKKNKQFNRLSVRHDLKKNFLRCSQNELQECRENAVAIYHSQRVKNTLPAKETHAKKIPRT
jgi:hypothetical protein